MVGWYHLQGKSDITLSIFFFCFFTKFFYKLGLKIFFSMLIILGNVDVDVFGYKYYIHSCLSPSGWIWTKSTSMHRYWVASQYGPHSLVWAILRSNPPSLHVGWFFKIYPSDALGVHKHPSVDIQECISNNIVPDFPSCIILFQICLLVLIFRTICLAVNYTWCSTMSSPMTGILSLIRFVKF